jgi:hypothetical protein
VKITARRASRLGLAALPAVGAFSVAFALVRFGDDGPRRYDDDRSVTTLDLPVSATAPSEPAMTADLSTAVDAAAGPEAAVTAFLAAEQAGAFADSFTLLAAEERARTSATAWIARHADLPDIVDFEVVDSSPSTGGRAEVTVRAALRPQLDEVVGLVPSAGDLTLTTVAEDGQWRVRFADSRLVPDYLGDGTAAADTRAWVARRAGCMPADEYGGGLLGAGAAVLAEQLCGAFEPVEVGAPRLLDDSPDADPYIAAFGPEVLEWARVVPVSSPAQLDVVVAPYGDRWLVIGASTPTA